MDDKHASQLSEGGLRIQRKTVRRGLLFGVVATAGAAALFTTLPAWGASVTPVVVSGNPSCPAGTTELKVEPVSDGTFTDGTLTVTLDVSGSFFDWTSNIGVDQVIVKGGPRANVYTYPLESTGDTGLSAPINPANGQPYGLSHVSFCYDVETPTTTTPPTTTTTSPTPSTTSTTPSSTSTTP
jgi:hypothetical protein